LTPLGFGNAVRTPVHGARPQLDLAQRRVRQHA
jgi:hypothetical protein